MTTIIAFQSNVKKIETSDEEVVLRFPYYAFTYKRLSEGLRQVLHCLLERGESLEKLLLMMAAYDGEQALPKLYYLLDKWHEAGGIIEKLYHDNKIIAEMNSTSFTDPSFMNNIDQEQKFILSRFAYFNREGNKMVLQSPCSSTKMYIIDAQAIVICHKLTFPQSLQSLLSSQKTIPADILVYFIHRLFSANLLVKAAANGASCEEDYNELRQWEFHDLLFHTSSRMDRNQSSGATFRFAESILPLPARKPIQGERSTLYRPDMEQLKHEDVSFTQVLEKRRSLRSYAEHPITVKQLGEFLYRTARVKQVIPYNPDNPHGYEAIVKCYPSGGAIHELGLYVCVNKCQGLDPGLYRYDDVHHEFVHVSGRNQQVQQLLSESAIASNMDPSQIQLSFHLTAQFQRVSWKYERIAYSLILKNVGVLYQTMYLVATAMNLAPSALGAGCTQSLSLAAGLDDLVESAVGEFILGSTDQN